MDLKNLITEAYKIACDKGWHDTEVSFSDYIANVHAEISEAWQEWRNNRGLDEIYYECKFSNEKVSPFNDCEKQLTCFGCEYGEPCGIPVELADVCILIFDYLGSVLPEVHKFPVKTINKRHGKDLSGFINYSHKMLDTADNCTALNSRWGYLVGLVCDIEEWCYENGIGLDKAIELKMAYNRTRPRRHGGKRV